jgi:hypothetical protein
MTRRSPGHSTAALAIKTAFVPPNAKEFDITALSGTPLRARPAT